MYGGLPLPILGLNVDSPPARLREEVFEGFHGLQLHRQLREGVPIILPPLVEQVLEEYIHFVLRESLPGRVILKGFPDDIRDLVGEECQEPLLDPLAHQAFLDNPGELQVNLVREELHIPLFDAPDEQLIEDEEVFGACGLHHLEVPLDLEGRLGPR